MQWLFAGMICLSVICAVFCGRIDALSQAALAESVNAVELAIRLCGGICLWNGMMHVARQSGLTDRISRMMMPILRPLFRGLSPHSEAARLISMNMAANLIGLGDAVTPLGIAAMKELDRCNPDKLRASSHMVLFVTLNTASLQLVPTTTAMLRLAAGSASPMEIMPAVWIASLCSVAGGAAAALFLTSVSRKNSF